MDSDEQTEPGTPPNDLPPLPPLESQLKEIDDPLPELVDMSLNDWNSHWRRLHAEGRLTDRDTFALTGHYTDPNSGERRRAKLDATHHTLPGHYEIQQHCDIDSIIGVLKDNLPILDEATLNYFPLPSVSHTLLADMHIPHIEFQDEHNTLKKAGLHKIANTRFGEIDQALIRIFFPRMDKSQCPNNVPKDHFMALLYDHALMPMAMEHIPEQLRGTWPPKYPNETWRAQNSRATAGGGEAATGARQQSAREIHGRYVKTWITAVRNRVDAMADLAWARGFFFTVELRGTKKREGSIHDPPEDVLVDEGGNLVYDGIARTRIIASLLRGFDMTAIHDDNSGWYVDIATTLSVARRAGQRAGCTFAFDLMHPYILNWFTNAEIRQCQSWVQEGTCCLKDDVAHLGCMAGFRFANPEGENTGIHYCHVYDSHKSIAYNLTLPKKVKQTSPRKILENWDKERENFFIPLTNVILDSASTHGIVLRLESRVSWIHYPQVHLQIPDVVVRPWLLYVSNSTFWGWMYCRLTSIYNVISQWIALRAEYNKRVMAESISALVLLTWMANALLKRPDEGSHWDEVNDAGSVHSMWGITLVPDRPLVQYHLHSLHLVPKQLPRISSLRTVSIATLLYLLSLPGDPMDLDKLRAMVEDGKPPAPTRKLPTSDPWGGEEGENIQIVFQDRTNNKQQVVNNVAAEDIEDQFSGLIPERERVRFPSEERDPQEREIPDADSMLLTRIVYDYPVQIFKKAPNQNNGDVSWCALDEADRAQVNFETFCDVEQMKIAFPSHINFGRSTERWNAAVAQLFPTIREAQTEKQNLSKLGARQRFISLLEDLPVDQRAGLVKHVRDYVSRRWRWLPFGKGRLWATGLTAPKYALREGPIDGGPWMILNPLFRSR